MTLPASFLSRPFTHRGLHDVAQGRAENSPKAFEAAIAGNYGIELDVQLSKDGRAMVFHDYDLARLADASGPIRQRTAAELAQIALLLDGDGIPTLEDVLALVAGRVPLLIEVKDQDGAMGPNVGLLEEATAKALDGYSGDAAVMSFNPHSVACFIELAPDRPRGLTTCSYTAADWPTVPSEVRDVLRDIPDFDRVGACFISHGRGSLGMARVAEIKAAGHPIFTWTIKSAEAEAEARKIADNITFEQYLA